MKTRTRKKRASPIRPSSRTSSGESWRPPPQRKSSCLGRRRVAPWGLTATSTCWSLREANSTPISAGGNRLTVLRCITQLGRRLAVGEFDAIAFEPGDRQAVFVEGGLAENRIVAA